ncbi:hypothetical protein N9B72_01445 [Bacteriovoracaceae bacterium]|nr:hypothetical protein [Bacteriovoracaceae bacterium]
MTINRGRCSVPHQEDNILFHDCDTGPGSSGTMLFGTWDGIAHILGINFAQYVKRGKGKCKRFDKDNALI